MSYRRWKLRSTTPGQRRFTTSAVEEISDPAAEEQLTTDQAAVAAKVAFIASTQTILGQTGTLALADAATIAGAVLDRADGIETNTTLRQALRIMAAILAGKVGGAGSGHESFTGLDGSTPRVAVTTDAAGNRTHVSYTPG